MFWMSLLKLGFTLKKIDLSVFSSLQRYFLHLPRTEPHTEKKIETYRSIKKKSKAKLIISTYIAFSKQYFGWPYLPFFNKPDDMQDRRPRFLQLISFSNLSMPENLVMTSPYFVYPYRLWDRVKKTSVGWGREFQTYVCCISFWRKKIKKKNKTKRKKNI